MNDKTKHTIIGFAFGLSALLISCCSNIMWGFTLSFAVGTIFFIGKEIYDKYKPRPTGFDRMDLAADYGGLLAGWAVSAFVMGVLKIISMQ